MSEFAIAKLRLEPGDILVVKALHGTLSPKDADAIRDEVKTIAHGTRILVIGPTIELSVLTRAEIEALSTSTAA